MGSALLVWRLFGSKLCCCLAKLEEAAEKHSWTGVVRFTNAARCGPASDRHAWLSGGQLRDTSSKSISIQAMQSSLHLLRAPLLPAKSGFRVAWMLKILSTANTQLQERYSLSNKQKVGSLARKPAHQATGATSGKCPSGINSTKTANHDAYFTDPCHQRMRDRKQSSQSEACVYLLYLSKATSTISSSTFASQIFARLNLNRFRPTLLYPMSRHPSPQGNLKCRSSASSAACFLLPLVPAATTQ